MAISTVNVDFSAILQNAAQATGLLRVRLSQVGTVEDSETGDNVILPIAWQETTLTDGAATLALVPNKIIEPSCTYYEIQLKSVPDCPKACAKLLISGIMYVPDEDCNVLDLLISPPSPETANTASGYASQAKQAAQVAENFAIQAGDRYDDVAEAAATALTDIGTAKQDALDAIGAAQSGATEAISTAEDAALQAIGQARGAALDDIGTAQGTAIGAVQAEGNTQVGRVYDASEDAVADVTAAQATAVSAVQAQQATSVEAVSAEGTAQVNAVTQAGDGYVATMQGLVSDAQAARDAAQTAQGLAEDAQAAAESASTDAQGYAGDASTSAGQAAQSASDAADSATAAQASAESIAASASQIAQNASDIATLQTAVAGKADSADIPVASDAVPQDLGTANAGTSVEYSRADHVHELPAQIAANTTAIAQNTSAITALETKTDITNKNVANIQALLNGTLYREETDSTAAYSKTVPSGALPYATINEIGGKTVVWNQLVQEYYNCTGGTASYDATEQTVTYTVSTPSTTNGTRINYLCGSDKIEDGHKYLIAVDVLAPHAIEQLFFYRITTTTNHKFNQFDGVNTANAWTTMTRIYTGSATGLPLSYAQIMIYNSTRDGFVAGDVVKFRNFVWVDLTLMFGAGNEPSSVAEFEAMLPSIDPAYNAGELRSAGVTEVVSEGRNLFDMSEGRGYPSDTTTSNTTPREFPLHKWVLGISFNNYFFLGNVNSATVDEDANIITVSSKVTGYGVGVPFKCEPNTAYTITYTSTVSTVRLAFYSKDNNYISYYSIQPGGTMSSPSTAYNALLVFYSEANTTAVFSNIQLERGTTATEYTPYRSPISYPVPSQIQALPGYGWSSGTVYNYVDYERKVYVQKVAMATFDGSADEGWALTSSASATRQSFLSSGYLQPTKAYVQIINDKGILVNISSQDSPTEANIITMRSTNYEATYLYIFVPPSILSGIDAFKAWLAANPITITYALATPIETDISSLLTDSTIEVEPGGTLTFKNQHGDDWRVPVPNSEMFLVQATPELPTTDGTYTLQCTVTDGTPSVTWVTA